LVEGSFLAGEAIYLRGAVCTRVDTSLAGAGDIVGVCGCRTVADALVDVGRKLVDVVVVGAELAEGVAIADEAGVGAAGTGDERGVEIKADGTGSATESIR
jgi:hypothetical protein